MDKPRILIVDDEKRQMNALCETLGDHGYETTGCGTGEEALALLRKPDHGFQILLSDLMMPGMDGITLLREALKVNPDLVGIIMTGQGTINSAVDAMKTGALDYILKPFKLSAAIPVLTRALEVRRLRVENATLARNVQERTAELEITNKELEAFAYSVSHDLRAPLRAISGFSKILMDRLAGGLSPDDRRLLDNVMGSARQMEKLIEDLLNFSRTGRQPLVKKTVNFTELAGQVVEELSAECVGRKVEFQIDDLPDGFGDPSLLKQVFVNLVSNAIKFTRAKPEAFIEIGGKEQPSELLCFVKDNGAGFNMEYAKNLFGVFQRLHRATEFEGTGVGLSIVQRIVHRHGGRIWAEAGVDKGAAFYFTLPRASGKREATTKSK